MHTRFHTFGRLITRCGGHVTVACDTEFKGPHTLTIQFAARVGKVVVVQIYRSPDVPPQPPARKLKALFPREVGRVVIRECRPITPDLSPADVLRDLFGLGRVEPAPLGWAGGEEFADQLLTVSLVGHFWPADFFRVFGRGFFHALKEHQSLDGGLVVAAGKTLTFRSASGFKDPVLGYATQYDWPELGVITEIRARYFDTSRTFTAAGAKLESLARMFLGVGKVPDFGEAEKSDMLAASATTRLGRTRTPPSTRS